MECCICKKKLNNFDDCPERWKDGHRVIICKSEKCNKEYTKNERAKYTSKEK